jgi:hypothetical protein
MVFTAQTRDDVGRRRPRLVEVAYQIITSRVAVDGWIPPLLLCDFGHAVECYDLRTAFGADTEAIAAGVLGIVYARRPRAIVQAFEAHLYLRRQDGEVYFRLTMDTQPKPQSGQVIIHYECPATIRVWAASIMRVAENVRLTLFREIPSDPSQDQGRFTRYYERAAEKATTN